MKIDSQTRRAIRVLVKAGYNAKAIREHFKQPENYTLNNLINQMVMHHRRKQNNGNGFSTEQSAK